MGPLPLSSLLRLFSNCPALQKARVDIHCKILQNVANVDVVSLESLVEFGSTLYTFGRFIPFLKMPLLERLQVCSLGTGVAHLADILPHDGQVLLSRATTMCHDHKKESQTLRLSGGGVYASFNVWDGQTGATSAKWFSDEEYIPFNKIEHLELAGSYTSADFPINLFSNAKTLQVTQRGGNLAESALGLLLPGAVIPCPSLQRITCDDLSYANSHGERFIDLAEKREQAGCRLEQVCMLDFPELDPDLAERLRGCVGEVRVEVLADRGH